MPGLDCGGDEQERYNADVAMIFVSRPPIKVAPLLWPHHVLKRGIGMDIRNEVAAAIKMGGRCLGHIFRRPS